MSEKIKIFISWSKEPSKDIAGELDCILKGVFEDKIKTFISSNPNSIESGQNFMTKIISKLTDSSFGIFILTKYNYKEPWLMFELGAMVGSHYTNKQNNQNITPIFFERNKLEEPINRLNLNSITYEKENYKCFSNLITTIEKKYQNVESLTENAERNILSSLEDHYKSFSKKVNTIIKEYEDNNIVPDKNNPKDVVSIFPDRIGLLKKIFDGLEKNKPKRIIIIGGIATIVREKINCFIPWLEKNKNSKLFICYESKKFCKQRIEQRKIADPTEKERTLLRQGNMKELKKEKEANDKKELTKKIEGINIVKEFSKNVQSNTNIDNAQVHIFEIEQMLSGYYIIYDTIVYQTSLLHDRSSDTQTTQLTPHFALRPLSYIDSVVDKDKLSKEIDNINVEAPTVIE